MARASPRIPRATSAIATASIARCWPAQSSTSNAPRPIAASVRGSRPACRLLAVEPQDVARWQQPGAPDRPAEREEADRTRGAVEDGLDLDQACGEARLEGGVGLSLVERADGPIGIAINGGREIERHGASIAEREGGIQIPLEYGADRTYRTA